MFSGPWFDITRFSTLSKAKNVMYRVLKFVDCMMVSKKKRDHSQRETLMPEARLRVAAHAVIISHCQEIDRSPEDLRKLKNLGATVVQFPVSDSATVEIAMMAARVPSTMVLEGMEHNVRPIIAGSSYLAYLIMRRDHFVSHGGPQHVLGRTRMEYWITKPSKIANKISSSCVVCIGMRAKNMQQKMTILDPVRTQPSPPFTHTAMDLAGPFLVADAVKKRVTKKVWVCIAVCRYTSAVNLEVVEDYSTNAFLQIFTNRRGTLTSILSDRGTQIVATSKATDDYFDMENLMERVGEEKKIAWEFAPVGTPRERAS